jgi:carbamoyl-phosphate synthase large subunit
VTDARPDLPPELTVIVTGAGGPAGVAVIRALRARGVRVAAVDADPMAAGLRLGDEAAVVPTAGTPRFIDAVASMAKRSGLWALISTVSEEIVQLAKGVDELLASGVQAWVPPVDAVRTCIDKWQLAQVALKAGTPSPATALGIPDGVAPPWIVKPRFGRGSRDVYAVDRRDELRWALARVPDAIVQTRLDGDEFTVDVLIDRDGSLAGAVPRWRLQTRGGISICGRTFRDDALLEHVQALIGAIGLQGPANVQGFRRAADGAWFLVEVNPRFSGALPLSLAAGADLVGEYLRAILGFPIRRELLDYRSGVTMVRHFEEVFEG